MAPDNPGLATNPFELEDRGERDPDEMFHVKSEREQKLSPIRRALKGRIRAASKSWRTRKKMAAARENQSGEA